MKKITAILAACLLCVACCFGCKKREADITVYMPDGAPALAMAQLLAEDSEVDGVSYRVVAPSLIASKVTNKAEEKNADLCVMPLTAASKLLGDGERYSMLGTVTHGNLYLVAKEGEYTAENLSTLIGKKVGVLQIKEVPGITLKVVLEKLAIPYQEMGNDGGMVGDKVNLLPISGANAVGTVEAECFLLAEPAASAQSAKGYKIVGDLQALYGGEEGYPQAVLVAKNSLLENRGDWVKDFTEKLRGGETWLQAKSGEEIVAAVTTHLEDKGAASSLKAGLLSKQALGRCGIRFAYAIKEKQKTEDFLSAVLTVNGQAAARVKDNFYWDYFV